MMGSVEKVQQLQQYCNRWVSEKVRKYAINAVVVRVYRFNSRLKLAKNRCRLLQFCLRAGQQNRAEKVQRSFNRWVSEKVRKYAISPVVVRVYRFHVSLILVENACRLLNFCPWVGQKSSVEKVQQLQQYCNRLSHKNRINYALNAVVVRVYGFKSCLKLVKN